MSDDLLLKELDNPHLPMIRGYNGDYVDEGAVRDTYKVAADRIRELEAIISSFADTHVIVSRDLLDECERALEEAIKRCNVCNDTGRGYTCPECYDANATLTKLRGQEKADV